MRALGILFPEETAHRVSGWGWVFGMQHLVPEIMRTGRGGNKRVRTGTRAHSYYARAVYAGRDDLALRVPALAPLRRHTVAVFGLGSLGAPAAIELARAGVGKLHLLDGDHIDAGPTVRWPLGLASVGGWKAATLEEFIKHHYPFTQVRSWNHQLGMPRLDQPFDGEVIDGMLDGASLLLDATAEMDTQRLLSRTAMERRIPYVAVVGKPGGWGGMIFRHVPGSTAGCWQCLHHALQEDENGESMQAGPKTGPGQQIPNPAADPAPGPQGRGCGDVTFTGAGFDMATLALDAVRKVAGTLCGPASGYPDGDWDVAIVSFRGNDGAAVEPTWRVFTLQRNPACAVCQAA